MTKAELLNEIKRMAASQELAEADLVQAYRTGAGIPASPSAKLNRLQLDAAKILYGLGGLIVIAGLIFLIVQMWDSFGAAAQIAVTLGSAIALYAAAVLLHQQNTSRLISTVFFLVSAIIMPISIFVTLHHLSPGGNIWLGQLIIAGLPAIVYGLTYALFRHPLLLFISILLSTWTLYALLGYLLDQAGVSRTAEEIWAYWTMLTGASYLLLGYAFSQTDKKPLTSALYFLGSGAALGSGFTLSNMQEAWLFIYFILILAAIYLSTLLRTRSLLFFGALYLILHLTHISFEYFADSLGWPLALIISGFMIIGIGYGTVTLNKRFISSQKSPAIDNP